MYISTSWKIVFLFISLLIFSACTSTESPIIVYSGKGLKNAVDEIVERFHQEHDIPVSVIYAGSNSLLKTIKDTQKGDVFIAGSSIYMNKLGEQANISEYLVKHTPAFVVKKSNRKIITSFNDLAKDGVTIAIGNKDMAAIGRVAEQVASISAEYVDFRRNVVTKASTVNELIELVSADKVDAAMVWQDMSTWEGSNNLEIISIPKEINQIKEVWVSELVFTKNQQQTRKFFDFITSKGKQVFLKHGFEE